jgi:hypothetical protein
VATDERWPTEQVRRPQTLPEGMFALRLVQGWYSVERVPLVRSFGTTTLAATAGVTDRLEFGMVSPKLICVEAGSPSGCDLEYRERPAGASAAYGLVRRPEGEVALAAGAFIDRAPRIFRGWAAARARAVRWQKVALELETSFVRDLNSATGIPSSTTLVFVTSEVGVQVTRRLFAGAGASLYAPPGALTDPDLLLAANASFTFHRRWGLHAGTTRSDLLPRRAWETRIGGTLYFASVVCWLG